ncbi:unnamed protein product [Didymodactylos carnosus]|uniref:Uncharacterized protein n=1 Tax=Didymodactylos carnosus TaxID=1234261 RepID=A0A8S2CT03_9BILA|nr:unnamed protein product [Didymodactylos carnosus]CAF3579212.1 unnamed protein product [Didymodactylos carnosus]
MYKLDLFKHSIDPRKFEQHPFYNKSEPTLTTEEQPLHIIVSRPIPQTIPTEIVLLTPREMPTTMYSVVGQPVPQHIIYSEPVPLETHYTSPILYSITGRRLTPEASTATTTREVIEPTVYSVIGYKPQNIISEPIQEEQPHVYNVSDRPNVIVQPTITRDIEPTLYSITGYHSPSRTIVNEPPSPSGAPHLYSIIGQPSELYVTEEKETPIPLPQMATVYSIVGQPQQSFVIKEKAIPSPSIPQDAVLHTIVGAPIFAHISPIQFSETSDRVTEQQNILPTLYSVIGKPEEQRLALTHKISDVDTIPTLYSIIGQPRVPRIDRPVDQPVYRPLTTAKENVDPMMYHLIGRPKMPSLVQHHQPPAEKVNIQPYLYHLVGQPKVPIVSLPLPVVKETRPPQTYNVVAQSKAPTSVPYHVDPYPKNINMHTIGGAPQQQISAYTIPMTIQQKTESPVVTETHIPLLKKTPTLYSVVGKPERLTLLHQTKPEKSPSIRARSITRAATPPPRRTSSLQNKPKPQHHQRPVHHFQPVDKSEEIISYSVIGHHSPSLEELVRKPEKPIIPPQSRQHHPAIVTKSQSPAQQRIERKQSPHEYRTYKAPHPRESNNVISRFPEPPHAVRNPTRRTDYGYVRPPPKPETIERVPLDTGRKWNFNQDSDERRRKRKDDRVPRPRKAWMPVWI